MSVATPPQRTFHAQTAFRRFSVPEYHRLIQTGILTDEDAVELLDGYLVLKMPRNPPHDSVIGALTALLPQLIPAGWTLRIQPAMTLPQSEPEPDATLVRGSWRDYRGRHPIPADVGMVLEVADSSLDRDRDDKGPIYAAAGLPVYWIINLVDRQVEVYSQPTPSGTAVLYAQRQDYRLGDTVPMVLDGAVVGTLAVQDVLP
jgi:Uma2 family endonuclease